MKTYKIYLKNIYFFKHLITIYFDIKKVLYDSQTKIILFQLKIWLSLRLVVQLVSLQLHL